MIHKLLLVLSLLFSFTLVSAQSPQPSAPPLLDAPDHWQIHDGSGPMHLEIRAEYMGNDGISDIYYLTITGTVGGQPYSSWAIALDATEGETLQVHNGDSGRWTSWEWDGDHYDKVGGTANRRSYYPVY
jgi:hypothetical protein